MYWIVFKTVPCALVWLSDSVQRKGAMDSYNLVHFSCVLSGMIILLVKYIVFPRSMLFCAYMISFTKT